MPSFMLNTSITAPAGRAQVINLRGVAMRAISTLFSRRVSLIVAGAVIAAIWWHNFTIADTIAAQDAVAIDCLCGLPWAIAWAVRRTVADCKSMHQKGGAL